ncbi:hypothetical protein [Nocardia sp. NBC_01329]|uniref:hypothetical protein n=1 Tax=Nocardia sp. NBC_01329 TaxID=2903594 RepID=UPI002E11BBBC|nr:hypothetical protein OG405_19565 [Nocardia sp. NBC_01329]
MPRDLPFDGEEEVTERGGDTAYRIASAASRVARGGAYVTGGALIANNGGGIPAPPSELDSRNAGWARNADPDPDVPSPVITFPDPVQTDSPGSGGDASTTMPLPYGRTLDIQVGHPGDFDLDDYYPGLHMEDIPGLTLEPGPSEGGTPGAGFMPGTGVPDAVVPGVPELGAPDPGIPPSGFPGFEGVPGLGEGLPLPGNEGLGAPGEFGLPSPKDAFQTDIFDLPRFDLSPDSAVQAVARDSADADWGFDLIELVTRPGGGSDSGWFDGGSDGGIDGEFILDGVGGDMVFADGFGHAPAVDSQRDLDTPAGPDGFWIASDWDLDITVGDGSLLDDRLDQYLDWARSASAASDSLESVGRGPLDPGARTEAAPHGTEPGTDAAGSDAGVSPGPGVAASTAAAGPGAALGAAGPVPVPMSSGAIAPVPMVAAPIAPVPMAPTPVPPPVVVPVAVAPAVQPVAATPLQTTVQPDAATTPMAHVFHPPAGQSPLTAPPAQVPDLFQRPPQSPAHDPQSPTESLLPDTSTPVVPTTTAPTTTGATHTTTTRPDGSTTPSVVDASTTPSVDASTTVDGSTATSVGGSTPTSPDGSTTAPETTTGTDGSSTATMPETTTGGESAATTGESAGVTTTSPVTGETGTGDISTEPVGGTGSNGPVTGDRTPGGTPSAVEVPTHQAPTVDQPSAAVPTVSVPTQQPVVPEAPAQAPVAPQVQPTQLPVAPQVKPVADHGVPVPYDVHGVAATLYTDHSVAGAAGNGLTGDLSAGLLPHTVAVTGEPIIDHGHWVFM